MELQPHYNSTRSHPPMDGQALSSDTAHARLIDKLSRKLEKSHQRILQQNQIHTKSSFLTRYALAITCYLTALILLVFFIVFQTRSTGSHQWIYPNSLLFECLLLVFFTTLSFYITRRNDRFKAHSTLTKLRHLLEHLKSAPSPPSLHTMNSGSNSFGTDFKIPISGTVSCYRVIRDGRDRVLPACLLVKGDVVQMTSGEVAPARCQVRYQNTHVLEYGQVLTREFISGVHHAKNLAVSDASSWIPNTGHSSNSISHQAQSSLERLEFQLLDTPALHAIDTALSTLRPPTLLSQQRRRITHFLVHFIIALLCISLLFSIIHIALTPQPTQSQTWFTHIPLAQYCTLLALIPLPLSLPLFPWTLLQTYATTKLLILWDALQKSEEPFDDEAEVDEFDEEAPAPIKRVDVREMEVGRRVLGALFGRVFRVLGFGSGGENSGHHENSNPNVSTFSSLETSADVDLLELLSSVTVICAVDREATLTSSFPLVEQLLFYAPSGSNGMGTSGNSGKVVERNVSGQSAQSQGLQQGQQDASKETGYVKLESHDEQKLHTPVSTTEPSPDASPPPQQTQLQPQQSTATTSVPLVEPVILDVCEDPSLLSTTTHIEITNTNSANVGNGNGTGFMFEDKDWQTHLASLKPFGLNLLTNTDCEFSQLQPPPAPNLPAASNDPNGTTATVNTWATRREYHCKRRQLGKYTTLVPARQRCMCGMALGMGFTGDVHKLSRKFERGACILVMLDGNISSGSSKEQPSIEFQILQDPSVRAATGGSTSNLLVFASGHVRHLLSFCLDLWTGSDLVPIDAGIRKKVLDLYQNAEVNDAYCIAYSYSPLAVDEEMKRLLMQKNRIIIVQDTGLDKSDTTSASTSAKAAQSTGSEDVDSVKILKALKSQIFLCMAAYNYVPKEDVKEFIEDLKIGGIRFVYFSGTPERESKAFAERLGLETDWNSCILLSSSDTSHAGYLEEHDIKAKLPRGIENVRPHLKNVDDIPLHVSLFADCNPSSIAEMIRIFQENGEVVLCVGNSLNLNNAQSFAAADISVTIDALPMRTPNKKLTKLGCASAFISLPTALSMPAETSPYALNQIIREARTIVIHMTQAFAFLVGCMMAVSLIVTLNTCFFLPPIFTGFDILWISLVILPPLGLSFLFSPPPATDVMKLMPLKNKDHLHDLNRFVGYFFGRFFLIIVLTILVHGMYDFSFTSCTSY